MQGFLLNVRDVCVSSRYYALVNDVPSHVTELVSHFVLAFMQRKRIRAVPAVFLRGGFAILLRGSTDCGVRYDGKYSRGAFGTRLSDCIYSGHRGGADYVGQ